MDKEVRKQVPGDVALLWLDYVALCGLRDVAVKQSFGYRKAKRASIEGVRKHNEFWNKCREMYPETKGLDMRYDTTTQEVYWTAETKGTD